MAAATSLLQLGAAVRLAPSSSSSSSMDSRQRLETAALSPIAIRGRSSPHDSMSPPSPNPPPLEPCEQPLPATYQHLTSHSVAAAGMFVPSYARRLNSRREPVGSPGSPGSSPHDSISPPDSPSPGQRGDVYSGPFASHHQTTTASGRKYQLAKII